MRLAILTPSEWDAQFYAAELARQRGLFEAAGHEVVACRWNAADDALLRGVDAVLPLIAWGYHLDGGRWFDLLDRIAFRKVPCVNDVAILRWNSDKAYLGELADKGVAVVPTLEGEGQDERLLARAAAQFATDRLVVKPRLSASGEGTYALRPDEPLPADVRDERLVVQPFLPDILSAGEMSLLYFDGRYSHAAVKRARAGEFRVQPEFGGSEEPVEAPAAARALAEAALGCAPLAPAYARVDLVMTDDGPLLMELELIEPDLFLRHAPDEGAGFRDAVLARLG
ncbi:ATP-grasp domain-containing protein [Sphingomicrobium astaxanthinifaciens]|uniref:ATP-grasp domain-containing protein n=1 Tax=Sphingomicrobium astaxanthinifaciens TaxID=1227949 RepID=UPI001FCB0DDF|nr:hypothetical protein [Sphingomicrobium astaxanthinifaciens]MCJ7421443.1 hypothetical protein [Sphingomicrobium astaxanthinifaciens]